MNVFIADDEVIIREGLKFVVNWDELGFSICGEASDGEDALRDILVLEPDLVLIDIRMPNLLGTEIVKRLREQKFKGHIIILSGYSDFKYAQTAIRYGVDYYLTKPIDEEELLLAVNTVKRTLEIEQKQSTTINQYLEKAKCTILLDILLNTCNFNSLNLEEIGLKANVYQVLLYENYNHETSNLTYNFVDLFKVTSQGDNSFEYIKIHQKNAILLKGDFAIRRLQDFLHHYENNPQKGSPLDSLFLAYGRVVQKPEDIQYSYKDALKLLNRRFFCEKNQHTLGFLDLPNFEKCTYILSPIEIKKYCEQLRNAIQSMNHSMLNDYLHTLEQNLYHATADINTIKIFLADIYLQIKQDLQHIYCNVDLPFQSNSWVIDYIESRFYLYEVVLFFSEQFEMFIHGIGNSACDSLWNDIVHYINHNYMDNLKLETLAPLFGYNSSYLGKLFRSRMGETFNSYLDQIRINHSKKLLQQNYLKVYEVAVKVGYKNVDYFHKKFKKYVGESPQEYRKK